MVHKQNQKDIKSEEEKSKSSNEGDVSLFLLLKGYHHNILSQKDEKHEPKQGKMMFLAYRVAIAHHCLA